MQDHPEKARIICIGCSRALLPRLEQVSDLASVHTLSDDEQLGPANPALVVVGPETPRPLAALLQARRQAPSTRQVLLVDASSEPELRCALKLLPSPTGNVRVLTLEPEPALLRALELEILRAVEGASSSGGPHPATGSAKPGGDGISGSEKGPSDWVLDALSRDDNLAVIVHAPLGTITRFSVGAERLLGYQGHEVLGGSISALVPRSRVSEVPRLLDSTAHSDGAHTTDTSLLKKDQTLLAVKLTCLPVLANGGDAIGGCWVAKDLSRQHELEQQLVSKESQLQDFMYSVSHDLRSPLITLRGSLDLLKMDLREQTTSLPESVEASVERIDRSVERMKQLLADLLILCRVGGHCESTDLVDVQTVVRELISEQEARLAKDRVALSIEDLPPASGDVYRVRQIFRHLIANAIEHGPTEQNRIVIGARNIDSHIAYFVRNLGPPIPAKFHEAVFQLFRSLKPNGKGTGAGLAIARRAAQAMGGSLELNATTTDYTEFEVRLCPANREQLDPI